MPTLLCYTKPGIGPVPQDRYPGHIAWNCDWEQSMHLAFSLDGRSFKPLRNDTGILFPLAAFDEGDPKGTTKTLSDPWIFRRRDGKWMVCAVRRNQNRRDSTHAGSIQLFVSHNLARWREVGFLKVTDLDIEVREPTAVWDADLQAYRITWRQGDQTLEGFTDDLSAIRQISPCSAPPRRARAEEIVLDQSGDLPDQERRILPGNLVQISEEELRILRMYTDEIRHVDTWLPVYRHPTGKPILTELLPKAVCRYSDGSTHEKRVCWNAAALAAVDPSLPGIHVIPGKLIPLNHAFPIPLNFGSHNPSDINDPAMYHGMSDPCVTLYRGKYYLSSSGNQQITLRCADRIEDVFSAEPVIIYRVPLAADEPMCGTWAAELHEIQGTLYMLTALCRGGDWTTVQAVVLRCAGEDPLAPGAWEAPSCCVLPDGGLISRRGISLDMTYFEDAGRHFVMWSNRLIYMENGEQVVEPAELDIATVDPARPWQLTSEPVCVSRPDYGWDRFETEVDEGPYLLRHGNELLVTISGSSTGMGDLYDVGLLRARSGADLLNPANWDKWPWPLLTKESVPGQYGPGHNNFVVDWETGDTVMVYHAISHEKGDGQTWRQPAIRRVHMAASGLPYLEMTPDRDVNPALRDVSLTLIIE